ncbi:RNA polymerase subunit AC19 [Exophiala xenobiotica]|uniref:RNA polymerase subunit AC19 n=1 Tax=Lithohypha guttulata TaxID=1690604 RepID=A0ABR0KD33_9EURO|nr:RNA polymerase subunit AC19 [Lithohypha guttulata]KAK5317710.1 RNA polymerase subunit AC19 [Exophiala xenobiotica]
MSNSAERDTEMANGEAEEDSADEQELLLGGLEKLVILPGQTSHAASFQIEQEDHTLGNSLRYFINKNPDVEFCGYTIPHPSETKMHIRIQTWEDTPTTAFDALRKGLEDMIEACDVVTEKFTDARDGFEASKQ